MTPEGYRARVREMGLTPYRPSVDGKTLHQTRTGTFQQVLDPDGLSPDEREDVIELLRRCLALDMN